MIESSMAGGSGITKDVERKRGYCSKEYEQEV
jgi:hypothetical protein